MLKFIFILIGISQGAGVKLLVTRERFSIQLYASSDRLAVVVAIIWCVSIHKKIDL